MRTNVLYMLKSMDKQDVGLQLALQCAPVITGIKVSNLFIIDKNMVEELYDIIDGTDISAFFLYEDEIKANILLYRKKELQQYILRKENQKFIRNFGYESVYIDDLLPVDCYGCRLWCPHVGTGSGRMDRAYQGPCYYIDRR